jgi:hypothetical protein
LAILDIGAHLEELWHGEGKNQIAARRMSPF